ncbi:uncharacterized protein LOC119572520 [Penaeus monodon]|uniref:uncharacterized protein LOC119572520 n=1 Tax=Penaeus monodon TaxID=6687 RepID=UPI0018A7963F|nr:uncharacterized protein LOC119572520 [Penaeus monodon]
MLMFLRAQFVKIYLRDIDIPSSGESMTSPFLVTSRFIWTGINKDFQGNSPYTFSFNPATSRFDYVHVDPVGPLPYSNGYRYILICTNRFTRWLEAIPFADIHADTAAGAFIASSKSSLKSDLGSTSAKLVDGTSVRVPGELLCNSTGSITNPTQDYAAKLRDVMSKLRPVQPQQLSSSKSFIPFDVNYHMKIHRKFFGAQERLTINRNETSDAIAIDRVKPAYLLDVPNYLANHVQPSYVQPKKCVTFLLPRHQEGVNVM